MKYIFFVILTLSFAATSYATPIMQVGVPNGSGGYVLNTASSLNPTETDTAITNGSTIAVAAIYGKTTGKDTIHIGGQYSDGSFTGPDWSAFNSRPFDTHETILIATVPDGTGSSVKNSLMLQVDGGLAFGAFHLDETNSYFPTNHAPTNGAADFLFFDIGAFSDTGAVVPNFQDSGETLVNGQIKTLTLSGLPNNDLAWIHFDVMALLSYYEVTGGSVKVNSGIAANLDNNPGSKDVTWKYEDDGSIPPQGNPVPEPSTFILLGVGLVGLVAYRRKKG